MGHSFYSNSLADKLCQDGKNQEMIIDEIYNILKCKVNNLSCVLSGLDSYKVFSFLIIWNEWLFFANKYYNRVFD